MKFLPLPDFDVVASALNFDTPDCEVIGGCDLYTTKAAGSDKKLYRNIDKSLESQHESLVRMSSSFSPPDDSLDLSRASPFGPLSQISSRRTFAYLIATLNASHPDYDFSHILRPSDFRVEPNLRTVMNTIDSTLYNLRPSPSMGYQMPMSYMTASSPTAINQTWGPQMWTYIDNEMDLKDCTIYAYEPMEDPYEGEEGTIWSLNYFFFNKQLKRVAYLYVRGVPVLSHNIRSGLSKRSASGYDLGANKRARYWLGDRADDVAGGDLDDWNAEDEVDLEGGDYDADEFRDDYDDEADDESDDLDYRSPIRAVSEDVAARMELEI